MIENHEKKNRNLLNCLEDSAIFFQICCPVSVASIEFFFTTFGFVETAIWNKKNHEICKSLLFFAV